MQKPAPAPIHPLLAERWSPCAFSPDPLTADQLTALAEAARWAPSCFGAQPWFFLFCDRGSDEAAFNRAVDCLLPGNQAWAKNAALLVIVCAAERFAHNDKPNRHHAYDSGAAALSLVLQAEALGLRAHQMAGFDTEKTRAEFDIPEGVQCLSFIAAGHQAAADTLPEDRRDRELATRERKPLGDNFFAGKFGRPMG